MNKFIPALFTSVLALFFNPSFKHDRSIPSQLIRADICIYGATPSGITAAVAARQKGKTVIVIEPSKWVGGILGAGLKPRQDCPNIDATGGLTRPLIETLGMRPDIKKWGDINPKDVREDFLKLLHDKGIKVIYDHRISRCKNEQGRLTAAFFDKAPFDNYGCPPEKAIITENLSVQAKVYIDCSYEGELMYYAGVSFRTGRESTLDYNEDAAGVRIPKMTIPIDPFLVPGNPASGLLNFIETDHEKPVGAGDNNTQAYNYRYYVTTDPKYRGAITPPKGYNAMDYELVGRYVNYLIENSKDETQLFESLSSIFPGWRNQNDYNFHRNYLITMAPVGIGRLYATGSWATKANIWKQYQNYVRGLHHFLSTDQRVPEKFRTKTAETGLDLRVHPETNGWPHQLYIRVSRRLIGNYTITEKDVYNKTNPSDPIGLAQYGIDIYPVRRYAVKQEDKNYVALEGPMFLGGPKGPTNRPYPISYRAITPLKQECVNLLVPICFSASHVGYASARMEPVFMICGESAGIAAAQAIDENTAVQDINMETFLNSLKKAGQVTSWGESQG